MSTACVLEIDAISLRVEAGERVVVSGSGGWTNLEHLAMSLGGDEITSWSPDVRAKAGLFVTWGRPEAVPGIRAIDLIHQIRSRAAESGVLERQNAVDQWCHQVDVDPELLRQPLDTDFSADEAMSIELAQLAVSSPAVAIMDLIPPSPSGGHTLINDALDLAQRNHPELAVVIITDDQELAAALSPTRTHTTPRDEAIL